MSQQASGSRPLVLMVMKASPGFRQAQPPCPPRPDLSSPLRAECSIRGSMGRGVNAPGQSRQPRCPCPLP